MCTPSNYDSMPETIPNSCGISGLKWSNRGLYHSSCSRREREMKISSICKRFPLTQPQQQHITAAAFEHLSHRCLHIK